MVIQKTRRACHWRKALLVWAAAQALAGNAQAGGVYFQPAAIPYLFGDATSEGHQITSINNAGQAVGVASNFSDGSVHPFLYAGGQMVPLGGAMQAGASWVPTAMSDPTGAQGSIHVAGNIVGGDGRSSGVFVQTVSTLANQVSPAQTFSIAGAENVDVVGINREGRFAGSFGHFAGLGSYQAYAASIGDGVTVLQSSQGQTTGAHAINNFGMVAGWTRHSLSDHRAAIWNGWTGALQELGSSHARGMNDLGTVVGDSHFGDATSPTHAFVHRNGQMSRIAANLDLGGYSSALATNMKGQTFGWFTPMGSDLRERSAFLYTDAGGAVSLAALGVLYLGGTAAINDFGQIVANGALYNPAGTLSWARQAGGNAADPNNWDSGMGFAPNRLLDVVIGTFRDQTVNADSYLEAKSLHVTGSKAGRATLQLSGGAVVNALEGVTVEARGRLQGAGRVLGPVVLNHGTVNALPSQLLTLDGGLDNHGLVTGNGRIEANLINRGGGAPGVQVGAGQHLTLAGTVHTAADASHINIRDGGTLAFEGRFVNQGGAVLAIDRGTLQLGYGATRMDNGGQVLVGSGRAEILGDVNNTPRGLVQAHDGADLTVWDTLRNDGEVRASGGSLIVYAGAVSGQGDFTGTDGMHRFQGGYGPGNSPAEVDIGNVQFASLVTMELGGLLAGSQHDRINFTGSARFEETSFLNITLINNFVPHAGDVFALFSYAQAPVGNFEDFYLPSLSAGLSWDVSRIHTTGVLAVTSVPEPSAAALWLAGLAAMGALARRRVRVA